MDINNKNRVKYLETGNVKMINLDEKSSISGQKYEFSDILL